MVEEGATQADVDPGLEFPAVAVSGDFVDRLEIVRTTGQSMVVTFGTIGDNTLLLPFIDWSVTTAEGTEARLITFENLAYVLAKMSRDYARVCQELQQLTAGPFVTEGERLSFARLNLDEAIEQLTQAKSHLPPQAGEIKAP
jgi:hypothetical protein